MKNLKKILLVATILLISSALNAQYLIDAIEISNRNISQVQTILDDWGWDTTSMTLNGVTSYKIVYNTTDVYGNPTIASGALFVPQIECDTMPLVSYQHGTEFNKLIVPSNNYYLGQALFYSGSGYITTLPDYLGLGDNPGLHPYIHWESEATASIDLIRAAREYLNYLLEIWDNNQLFLAGYSQGGHSTMALHKYIKVNNLQNEFNIVASAPMSGVFPCYDVQFLSMVGGDSTYPAPEFLPYIIASYQMVYGNLYENYNEYYDPPYDSIIASWVASGTDWGDLPTNFYDFMQDSVLDNMQSNPDHPFNVDLRENDLHNWLPQEPVRVLYCTMDHLVPFENSIMAQDTMNALGAPDVQAIDVYPSGDHFTCFVPATIYSLEWFDSLRLECEMAIITSIPSIKKQDKISLYPNPVKDLATFSSEEITSFEIYNMLGVLITRRNNNKVDMSSLSPGVYFVIGYNKGNYPLYTGKIIKK